MSAGAGLLRLTLHDRLVGYLEGQRDGRNVLRFAGEFTNDPGRPTFSLTTHPDHPRSDKVLSEAWTRHQRLHPVLSNLLPEGALREMTAQELKVHVDHEFQILSHLGADLPGALVATPMAPESIGDMPPAAYGKADAGGAMPDDPEQRFSLAGVQMKFSMKETDGRYDRAGAPGDWIVKTPSTEYRNLPLNEYTAMSLAAMAGVEIPEIRLADLDQLDNLPAINLPDEKHAFAIRRFDRNGDERVHAEDFAQVLVQYPHEKYDSASYEQIGRLIHQYSGDGLADAQQLARRLLVNILLANGDAHLKNWSLVYPDRVSPRLSPAYDIVTTSIYIEGEKRYALNLNKTKEWYEVTMGHFRAWAKKAGLPWRAVKPHLDEVMEQARTLWPEALEESPMDPAHRQGLKTHWGCLRKDFRIDLR